MARPVHDADETQRQAIINVQEQAIKARPKLSEAALREVNIIRGILGMPTLAYLQTGNTGLAWACPIANSLQGVANGHNINASVTYDTVTMFKCGKYGSDDEWMQVMTPPNIRQFMQAFDKGILPAYKRVGRAR